MGRKIPGRKHRGVRDPEKQREQRLFRIKDKINAPPLNPDDQEIPKSLQELMQLKEKAQKMSKGKDKNKDAKANFKPIMKLPNGVIYNFNSPKTFFDPKEKPAPIFMQEKGESDSSFIYRMNKVCESIIQETEFENKYNVKVHRSRETGEVLKVTKRPKDELEELVNKAKKETKKGKKKSKVTDEPRLTKSQKRRKKLLEKKQQKQNNKELDIDRLNQKDTVKFGEVVHQPPTLTLPRKVENLGCAARPGKKDLLLKSMIGNNNGKIESTKTNVESKFNPLRKTTHKVINRKGKRKDLPVALRRQLDKQQKEVINAYKELKKQKLNR